MGETQLALQTWQSMGLMRSTIANAAVFLFGARARIVSLVTLLHNGQTTCNSALNQSRFMFWEN